MERSKEEQRKLHDLHVEEVRRIRMGLQEEYELKMWELLERCSDERDTVVEKER